ncbi:FAD-dependent oxidoreductase [Legionella spiritensis]|uniref:Alkyl hydroperoxide reductase subunit F n=1 Tax=Legionella spiritensis TaxID=452 RepID=A0A0W0Z1X0_LEGSP|nr:FAD-dependent monooxygenase [Legionella spiritensis]KTD63156.1 FAD dependent oxidoreductase [Legionella spiritensis]SNV45380.1 FAD dependent oxidoreductase [Legionella spiritensis]
MTNENCDVLIVGAGPTGLMMALELARSGLSFIIIDKKKTTSEIMKATAISPVALEGFADLNYIKPFEKHGVFTNALSIYLEGKQAMRVPWRGIESRFPQICLLGQNYVERFQQERLSQFGHQVCWNTTLVDLDTSQDNPVALVIHNQNQYTITCRYVIGCDGSRSKVRELVSIPSKGKKYPSHYIIADVKVDGDFRHKDWYFFFAKKGFCSVGSLPGERSGILLSLSKKRTFQQGEQPVLSEVQTLFDELCDIPGKLSDPYWISHFHTYNISVKQRKKGRILLCGDAAHQVSPLTSLGMNSGLLDARNLAWKLVLVCRDIAAPALLDSYEIEQNQTLKEVKWLSDANEHSFSMIGLVSREIRDHLTQLMMGFEPVKKLFGGLMSQTAARFRKSPIIDEYAGLPWHISKAEHWDEHGGCLKAWSAFGHGPQAGERAPDVFGVTRDARSPDRWLYDGLLEGRHALLIFLGCEHCHHKNINQINNLLGEINSLYSDWIQTAVVLSSKKLPPHLHTDGLILYDVHQAAHQRYGAEGNCLYCIRPDRFVGYRSIPPRLDKLQNYLAKLLLKKTK